jgi:hypothetical protein
MVRVLIAAVLIGLFGLVSSHGTGVALDPVPSFLNSDYANDARSDSEPSVAADGDGIWVAVWLGNSNQIYRARSTDDGSTWSSPIQIASGTNYTPTVATDKSGTWIVSWTTTSPLVPGDDGDVDVAYQVSHDDGASWSSTTALNSDASALAEAYGGPDSLAFGNGVWIASWNARDPVGQDSDLYFARSFDSGATWTSAAFLVPSKAMHDGSSSGDFGESLATDGAGNWMTAWLTSVPGGPTVGTLDVLMFSRSEDNGATWADHVSLATGVLPSLFDVTIATGAGTWVIAYDFEHELFTTASTDLGQTWSTAESHGTISQYGEPALAHGGDIWFLEWQQDLSERNVISYSSSGEGWFAPIPVSPLRPKIFQSSGTVVTDGSQNAMVVYEQMNASSVDTDLVYVRCGYPISDPDCDSLPNSTDICPLAFDYDQIDLDGDGAGDACDADRDNDGVLNGDDNCPNWTNPSQANPWGNGVDDEDCDGFLDYRVGINAPETTIGTDPLKHCAATPTQDDEPSPDAWAPDFNDNRIVNGQDLGKFGAAYGRPVGDGPFGSPPLPGERFDFTGNGIINGQDIGKFGPFYGKSCA